MQPSKRFFDSEPSSCSSISNKKAKITGGFEDALDMAFDPLNELGPYFSEQNSKFLFEAQKLLASTTSILGYEKPVYELVAKFNPSFEEIELLLRKYGQAFDELAIYKLLTFQDCKVLTSEQLDQLLVVCENLKAIDLGNCSHLNFSVKSLLRYIYELNYINLHNCKHITDLEELSNFSKLYVLNLSECSQVTDDSLSQIVAGCRNLEEIYLDWCSMITDKGVASFALHHNLKKASFWRCQMLTDDSLKSLSSCPSLTYIELWGCERLTDQGLINLVKSMPQLTYLGLKGIPSVNLGVIETMLRINPQLTIDSFIQFEYVFELKQQIQLGAKELVVNNNIADHACIAMAPYLSAVVSLDLKNNEKITVAGLTAIAVYSRNLSELNVSYVREMNDQGLAFFGMCSNLKSVDLSGCKSLSAGAIERFILRIPNLQQISLVNIPSITEEVVQQLAPKHPMLTIWV